MPTATPAAKAATTTERNTAAILTAMRLVNGSQADTDQAPAARPAAVPSAKARVALDRIAAYGSYDEFNATMPNIKALLRDVLGWNGQNKLNKVINRTVVGAMSTTDETTGYPLYPQAVEMLSFLALCAPLLEPDRLARIAALAQDTPNAYKPIRYMVKPAGQLRALLSRYNEARREQLLASLWVTAHDGRWWDATSGTPVGQRRRRRNRDDRPQEQRDAIAEQIQAVLAGDATPSPHTVGEAFLTRQLTYSPEAAQILGTMRVRNQAERKELTVHLDHPDSDVPVLLSYVRALYPDERPESPIPALIDSLARDLGEDIDEPDALPDRPEEWEDLYPAASREGFPMPNRIRALGNRDAPGLPGSKVRMMRHADMLRANANHMGNCTFSYRARSEAGSAFIGHLEWDGGEYNFAVNARRAAPDGPVTWTVGEINSRFNRGNVPQQVRTAVQTMVAGLND